MGVALWQPSGPETEPSSLLTWNTRHQRDRHRSGRVRRACSPAAETQMPVFRSTAGSGWAAEINQSRRVKEETQGEKTFLLAVQNCNAKKATRERGSKRKTHQWLSYAAHNISYFIIYVVFFTCMHKINFNWVCRDVLEHVEFHCMTV